MAGRLGLWAASASVVTVVPLGYNSGLSA